MAHRLTRWGVAVGVVASAAAGCAEPSARPLRPEAFLGRRVDSGNGVQPVDQSGGLSFDDAGTGPERVPEHPSAADPVRQGFSPTVRDAVRPPLEGAAPSPRADAAPATRPATGPSTAPELLGGFQLVGTVLAEVNGAPIFADRVLAAVDRELAAQAKRLDPREFQAFAARAIKDQIDRSVYDELEFAMAQRRLEPRDADLARMATVRWKQEQITRAGGSVEVARQRAAAAGYNFEELAEEQYRLFMRRLYYEKRELPKIQVSAADIRRYYKENAGRDFSTPDRARFRVIKVDKRKAGGRDEALVRVNALRDRVKSGTDFVELAAQDNDEESFKKPVEWFLRGSFVVKEVEDAVWQLSPGQVGDVIETPEAFFIAKLEAKEPGRVRVFEEPDVQREIEKTLKDRQFTALRAQRQKELIEEDKTIRYHPQMIQLAVEMAMQKYRYWQTS